MAVANQTDNNMLLHDLKQRFPEIPEGIVCTFIQQNANDQAKCIELLEKESPKYMYGEFQSAESAPSNNANSAQTVSTTPLKAAGIMEFSPANTSSVSLNAAGQVTYRTSANIGGVGAAAMPQHKGSDPAVPNSVPSRNSSRSSGGGDDFLPHPSHHHPNSSPAWNNNSAGAGNRNWSWSSSSGSPGTPARFPPLGSAIPTPSPTSSSGTPDPHKSNITTFKSYNVTLNMGQCEERASPPVAPSNENKFFSSFERLWLPPVGGGSSSGGGITTSSPLNPTYSTPLGTSASNKVVSTYHYVQPPGRSQSTISEPTPIIPQESWMTPVTPREGRSNPVTPREGWGTPRPGGTFSPILMSSANSSGHSSPLATPGSGPSSRTSTPIPVASRTRQQEDYAYTQALLLHQRARFERLQKDLKEETQKLEMARKDVDRMEGDVVEKRSRGNLFPNAQDLNRLKQNNRQLQIDIQCMSQELEMGNRMDNYLSQGFYENMRSTGAPGPIPPLRPNITPQVWSESVGVLEAEEGQHWSCRKCTLFNHPALDKCELCESPRG